MIDDVINFFKQTYNNLIDWIKAIFNDVIEFFLDLPIQILKLVTDAITGLFNAIAVPDFISNGFNSIFGLLSPDILFFMDKLAIAQGLAILGIAFAFRMGRKLLTLFQW